MQRRSSCSPRVTSRLPREGGHLGEDRERSILSEDAGQLCQVVRLEEDTWLIDLCKDSQQFIRQGALVEAGGGVQTVQMPAQGRYHFLSRHVDQIIARGQKGGILQLSQV